MAQYYRRFAPRGMRLGIERAMRDESGNNIAEYAIVLTALVLATMLSFQYVGKATSNVVVSNQNNLSNQSTMNYPTYYAPP